MDLVDAFRWQARACAELGSPMYAALLDRVAGDVAQAGAVTRRVLRGHEGDSGPSAVALRLAGAVHRQVLAGAAPDLAPFYPSVGGSWDLDAAWPAFVDVLERRHAEIRQLLERPPQTNEVGRASALMGGLLHITARTDQPIRLVEVGASGGLNLRADHFRYQRADGSGWGDPASPVVLDPAWQGATLPEVAPQVVERVGTDLTPVDVTTEAGRLTLLSYVWPDQLTRLARLRGACELADRVPVQVHHMGAVDALAGLELRRGTTTVLWHSVMWQYLTEEDKLTARQRIATLAALADAEQAFAHLRLEPRRRAERTDREFLVELDLWPAGPRQILGSAAPHGVPVSWD